MSRTVMMVSLAALALSVSQAAAQVSPAPGAALPPNFLPGYSPLVPAINTFPSTPRYSPSFGWYRSAFGPATMSAPPVIVTSNYPGVIVAEPIYTTRPFRRFGWRR